MATITDAKFSCAACGRQYSWKPELAGKRGKCKCGAPLDIPASIEDLAAVPPVPAPSVQAANAPVPSARPAARSAEREPTLNDLAALARGEVRGDDAYRCPWCGSALQPKSVVCSGCKMNIKTGRKHDPKKEAARTAAAKNAASKDPKNKTKNAGSDNQAKQLATLAIVLLLLLVSGGRMYFKWKRAANTVAGALASKELGQDAEAKQLLADNEPIEAREFLDANKQRSIGIQMTNNTAKLRVEDWYRMGSKKVWAFNAIMSRHIVLELPEEKDKRAALFQWTNDTQRDPSDPLKDEGQKYIVLNF